MKYPSSKDIMREQVEVVLDADFTGGSCPVGTLYYTATHGRGTFSFQYLPQWLARPDAFEIDSDLQLHGAESFPAGAEGGFRIFLDSAPDRWGRLLLDRRELLRARDQGRKPRALTEWDYVLGVHDTCRTGALRFRRDAHSPYLDNDPEFASPPIASLRELEAASFALEAPDSADRPQFRRWLTALLAPGSSLGGARPKANFTDGDGRLWIAKFPSRNDRRDVGAWEMLVQQMALAAGVEMSPAKCIRLGSKYRTFCAQRFDRAANGTRRFFVSAMALLGRNDGDGGSYLELADFLSSRATAKHRRADLRQLWTRVVFNILVSNTDDHLRNHGFILERGGWRPAPAYDVNPNLERPVHTLAIDERDTSPDLGLALETAQYYELARTEAERILKRVSTVVGAWRRRAAALKFSREEIETMASAFRTE